MLRCPTGGAVKLAVKESREEKRPGGPIKAGKTSSDNPPPDARGQMGTLGEERTKKMAERGKNKDVF